jgi:hypothetical protein
MRGMLPVSATLPTSAGDIGRQLEAAFRTFWVHWKAGFALAFIAQLIALLPAVMPPFAAAPESADPMQSMLQLLDWYARPSTWLLLALVIACQILLMTALSYRLGCCGRGQDPGLVASVNRGLSGFPAALGATLLYLAGLLLSLLPMLLLAGLAASDGLGALARSLLALLALSALGLPTWWSLAASLYLFAVALERRGAVAALQRSLNLIRGRWWLSSAVVGIVLLVHLTVSLLTGMVVALAAMAGTLAGDGSEALLQGGWVIGAQLLMSPVAALLQILLLCGLLAVFNDRVLVEESGSR